MVVVVSRSEAGNALHNLSPWWFYFSHHDTRTFTHTHVHTHSVTHTRSITVYSEKDMGREAGNVELPRFSSLRVARQKGFVGLLASTNVELEQVALAGRAVTKVDVKVIFCAGHAPARCCTQSLLTLMRPLLSS